MALLDVTTLQERRALLHSVPAEMRISVLRAANPKLVAELDRLATQPRRCRDLTADSVEEIVSWCSDEDILVGILENDTRAGVAQVVRARLNALGSDLTVRQNAKNIRERTERAVSAPDVLAAIGELKETDAATVLAWYASLDPERREVILPRLLGFKNHDYALTRELLRRSIDGEDLTAPGQVVLGAAGAPSVLTELLTEYTGPMTERLAEAIVYARLSANAVPVMPVLPEATELLVNSLRVDLLAKLECIPADEVCRITADTSSVELALAAARSPEYVDALAANLSPRGKLSYGSAASTALNVSGISPASRFVLLTYTNASDGLSVMAGEVGDMPGYDEVVRYVTWVSKDRDSLHNLVNGINRVFYSGQEEPTPNYEKLADAMYDHAEKLLIVLTKSYYRYQSEKSWLSSYLMAKAAATIADTPGAWEAFFTSAPSHSGTMDELATAVVLAAS